MSVEHLRQCARVCLFGALALAAAWAAHFNLFVSQLPDSAVGDPFVYTNAYLAAQVFARNLAPLFVPLILLFPFASIRAGLVYAAAFLFWLVCFLLGDGALYLSGIHGEIVRPPAPSIVWERVLAIAWEFGVYFIDVAITLLLFRVLVHRLRGPRAAAATADAGSAPAS